MYMKNLSGRVLSLTTVLLLGLSLTAIAKPKKTQVWMFGFSASFTDSTIYISNIQLVDPVFIESSTGFLYDRSIYSLQVENFVEEQLGKPRTTCTIFFDKKRKKMDNKLFSIRKRFLRDGSMTVMPLEGFTFVPVDWTEHDVITINEAPKQ